MRERSVKQHGRKFDQIHKDAGYHLQDWGPPPTPDSELIGTYEGSYAGEAVTLDVRHLAVGPTGAAEFEIQFGGEYGSKVTVLNEDVVLQYLAVYGVVL